MPTPAPSLAFLLSSSDEAVAGPSQMVPQDDARACQELLKRVAVSLALQAEELAEPCDAYLTAWPRWPLPGWHALCMKGWESL